MSKLIEERENGTYYLGDLSAAKAYLLDWYSNVHEWEREDGSYIVAELDDNGEPQSWGCSSIGDAEEAWRYFAGTDFGPLDEHYDDDHLRNTLDDYKIAKS